RRACGDGVVREPLRVCPRTPGAGNRQRVGPRETVLGDPAARDEVEVRVVDERRRGRRDQRRDGGAGDQRRARQGARAGAHLSSVRADGRLVNQDHRYTRPWPPTTTSSATSGTRPPACWRTCCASTRRT